VNEAVDGLRASRGPKVAGFANAVLRKIAAEGRPPADEIARAPLASLDPRLRKAIVAAIGEEAALRLVSDAGPPPLGIRVEDPAARETWLARLREARPSASFEPGVVSPHAIVARGAGRPFELPGYREGAWSVQEEGSQAIALELGATPTDVVLDACAGRGNKTGLLARAAAAVDAADIHAPKLERLREELGRIGVAPREAFAVDWSRGTGGARGPYDRILVDAPCSGIGTLRRRPELALRRVAEDLPRLRELQRAILARTATLLRPGGRLVYAVCSVTKEEGEDVLADAAELGLRTETTKRLLPHEHGTDGYFIARLVHERP
jgi:16S rRNA (cytosine967-C5)-methyltransferase